MVNCNDVETQVADIEVNVSSATVVKLHKCDVALYDTLINAVVSLANGSSGITVDESNLVIVDLKDSGGSLDANVDGSVTPVTFLYKPPAGKRFVCGRMLFYMEDNSVFSSDNFGSIPALTNGVSICYNGVETRNWKTNMDVITTMYDNEVPPSFATEQKAMAGRLSFTKMAGNVRGLNVLETDGFEVKIQDNLGSLTHLRFSVQGYLEDV